MPFGNAFVFMLNQWRFFVFFFFGRHDAHKINVTGKSVIFLSLVRSFIVRFSHVRLSKRHAIFCQQCEKEMKKKMKKLT